MMKNSRIWICTALAVIMITGSAFVLLLLQGREMTGEQENPELLLLEQMYPEGNAKLTEFSLDTAGVTEIHVSTSSFGSECQRTFYPEEEGFHFIETMLAGEYFYAGMLLNDSAGGSTEISLIAGADRLYDVYFAGFSDKIFYNGYYYEKNGGGLDSGGILEMMEE